MSTEELRAATERLRRWRDAETPEARLAVYGTRAGDPLATHRALRADEAVILNAYLAEHPEDSDQPVTVEWLRSVGFEAGILGPLHIEYVQLPGGLTRTDWFYERAMLPAMVTRGHVRRLLAALGIPLEVPRG